MTEMTTIDTLHGEALARAADQAVRAIPPAWPLTATVAVNPFLGQITETLDQTAARLARIGGVRLTLPRKHYADLIAKGEITDEDLVAALEKRAPNFSTNAIALKQLIEARGYKHVDEYLAQPEPDASLKATATSIISAWYLGIVGEPVDAELVAYSQALMYQPTHGILIIPTYGGGPATWGAKPAAIEGSKV